MAQSKKGGTVLRGSDGSLYFIRDEVLETLKIAPEGKEKINSVLKDVKGDAAAAKKQGEVLGYVSGDLLKDQPEGKTVPSLAAKSTYMCPWFCHSTPS